MDPDRSIVNDVIVQMAHCKLLLDSGSHTSQRRTTERMACALVFRASETET